MNTEQQPQSSSQYSATPEPPTLPVQDQVQNSPIVTAPTVYGDFLAGKPAPKSGYTKLLLSLAAVVAFLILGTVTTILLLNKNNQQAAPSDEQSSQLPVNGANDKTEASDIATSNTTKQESASEKATFKLFVPTTLNWEKPYYMATSQLFTYSSNVKSGTGIIKGAYGFFVYPAAGSSYAPPTNCGAPPGYKITPIACTEYSGSTKYKAYTTNKQAIPGGIENTQVKSYISMYAEREGSVIIITSADTDAAKLYSILTSMKEVPLSNIPSTAGNR